MSETSFVPGWAIAIPLIILAGLWLWLLIASVEDPNTIERNRDVTPLVPVEPGVWRHGDEMTKCHAYPDSCNFTYVGPGYQIICTSHNKRLDCFKVVEPKWWTWCSNNPVEHHQFITDDTGMVYCGECGSGCETDYSVPSGTYPDYNFEEDSDV